MLVLSRKVGEAVVIGGEIEVVVLDAGHGRIKLGFRGPREVSIRRGELDDNGVCSAQLAALMPNRHETARVPARECQVASLS